MKRMIFIVEDDIALQELYTYSLENEFDCRCFGSGKAFFEALANNMPDIIILDIMLPGDDGFMILSRLKADNATADIPVIILSAKGEEISKNKGLQMGAETYIAKPFGVLELLMNIKGILRKNVKISLESVIYKDIVIDFYKNRIIVNGKQIHATLKEYNLLRLLCENAEKVQDRKTIFTEVWGNIPAGETRTLDIHIKEIRKKLSEAKSKAIIRTVIGVGYMLA